MPRPLRLVTADRLMQGRGSVLGHDTSRRTSWYELDLECGHTVERTAGYVPFSEGKSYRRTHRSLADVKDPPKRARCDLCAQ